MPRTGYIVYIVEPIHEECLIHDGVVRKVKGQDAFLVDMRVIGQVMINGKYYRHNDVLTLPFTPSTDDE